MEHITFSLVPYMHTFYTLDVYSILMRFTPFAIHLKPLGIKGNTLRIQDFS